MEMDSGDEQAKLDKAYALAFENEQKIGCCSQCVLAAIQDVLGGIDDAVFKAAHTLAGGGALTTGGTCGALAGGMLALGSHYGRDRAHFAQGQHFMPSYRLGKQLQDRFVAEFGSPVCAEIQKKILGKSFDLWNRDDFKAFEAAGGHLDKCPHVAGQVAKWITEILIKTENDQ